MASRKKWEIAHLAPVRRFRSAACIITSHRLRAVIDLAHTFKASRDVEDLHQLRIALRRLRYPLETLLSQFRRKSVLRFIDELNMLQDAAGAARDLDVLMERLTRSNNEQHWQLRRIVFLDLEAERRAAYAAALDAIDMFLVSPMLYDFKTGIEFERHDPAVATSDPYDDAGESDNTPDDAPEGAASEPDSTIPDQSPVHSAAASPRNDGKHDGGRHVTEHLPHTHSDRLF
ncbi:MAG: CHAD domain-containing protein [Ignavibacteriae bacterium]|nr:CHAD domain-containing protein [Ignavibacteriota bacterium]